ncbi:MAG: DUF2470 domain-containing protein [Pseudomonadota bacterium]
MTPLEQGKKALRLAGSGTLAVDKGTSRVSLASDLDGAPLLRWAAAAESAVLTLEGETPVVLKGALEPVLEETLPFATARYQARHPLAEAKTGAETCAAADVLMRFALSSARIGDSVIPAEALLSQASATLSQMERRAVDHMNEDHLDAIKGYAEALLGEPPGDWRMTALDMEGLDLQAGARFTRLWFDPPLAQPGEIRSRLVELAMKARA